MERPLSVSEAPERSSDHVPALDGIRGTAVLAIMLYHGAGLDQLGWLDRWVQGAFLSLSAFFTLSGFLICSLLLREEHASGAIGLGRFWSKRARRLLPAVYLLLIAVLLLAPLLAVPAQLDGLGRQSWTSVFYVVNWDFILSGTDYSALFVSAPSPLQHLWSLAVEEQWYIMVPLAAAAVIAYRRARGRTDRATALTRLGWGLVGAAAAGTMWMWWVSGGEYTNRAYMGTDTRLAEMLVGAAAATFLARGFRSPRKVRAWIGQLAPIAAAVLLLAWMFVPFKAPLVYRGGFTLHAVLLSVVLIAAVQRRGAIPGIFSLGFLTYAGRISYGLYLYHWPVMLWLTPDRLGVDPSVALVVQLLLTFALAALSARFLELPVRRGDWPRGTWVLVSLIAAIAVIAVGVWRLPEPDRRELLALGSAADVVFPTTTIPSPTPPAIDRPASDLADPDAPTTSEPAPTTTVPLAPLRVMVVGDSFAESVAVGLQRFGVAQGSMAVMNRGVPNCPFARTGSTRGLNITRDIPDYCAERDASLEAALADFDPDVVLLTGGFWDVTDRRPDNFPGYTTVGDPTYDQFLTEELQHLTQLVSNGGARVVWTNSPYWDPVKTPGFFMGKPPYIEADPARADAFNAILAAAIGGRADTTIVDIQAWLAGQPGGPISKETRPDGVHFSEATTDIAAAWLGPELLRLAGRQGPA
jgi:peptidoglycan/LPS O-acetylase OafA/YrhL/lysophospholipase L1-like esterase